MYGLDKKDTSPRPALLSILGGGAFDVSLLLIDDGVFEVLATASDTHLGGKYFDNCVIEYFVRQYKKKLALMFQPMFMCWTRSSC